MMNMSEMLDPRVERTVMIMSLLDSWRLGARDQVNLLGLEGTVKPRNLVRYQQGTPLPDSEELETRLDHIIGIADALRTSFPMNAQMGEVWLNRKNNRFGDRSPLQAMLEDGLRGMVAVRMHLDCAWDWHQDDCQN